MAFMWALVRLLGVTGILRLVFRLMLDRRVPLGLKILLPGALAYLISPIDLVPDFLPGLGRLDDILVIVLTTAIFLAMAPRDVVLEHLRGRRRDSVDDEGEDGRPKPHSPVIEGSYRKVDDEDDAGK